jgi:CBS domain-containing protein
MKVLELMTSDVKCCSADDSLDRAANLMWEGDCGVIPVVGPGRELVGMITDRDICMAAYTKGRPLAELEVRDAMAKEPTVCSPEATLETAISLMKESRVRRLGVVDSKGLLAGILSLNDLAIEARKQERSNARPTLSVALADMLGTICEHREPPAGAKPRPRRTEAWSARSLENGDATRKDPRRADRTFHHLRRHAGDPRPRGEVVDHVRKLEHFFDGIVACHVVLSGPHRHRKGGLYRVRIDLTVPGEMIVVDRDAGLDHSHQDARVAVREAFLAARRKLQDYVRCMRGFVKHHEEPSAAPDAMKLALPPAG